MSLAQAVSTDGRIANNFTRISPKHEGRSINKLQNGVILLIFKMWQFRKIRFVGILILNTSCEFYYDDVTVTSFINIRYSSVATESIAQKTAFCYQYSFLVGQRIGENAIQSEMHPVYGDKYFMRPAVNSVKSLLIIKKVLLLRNNVVRCCFNCGRLMQRSQQFILSYSLTGVMG